MPIARYQMPDGRIAKFEVPDGTTPEQAMQLMERFPHSVSADTGNKPVPMGMSGLEKFMRGGGNVFRDAAISVEQMMGRDKEDQVARNRVMDYQIDNSPEGLAGKVAGAGVGIMGPGALVRLGGAAANSPRIANIGSKLMSPRTLKGAALQGGVIGGLTPTLGDESRAVNTGIGAAGGVTGQYLGDKLLRAAGKSPDALAWLTRQAGHLPQLKDRAHKVSDKLKTMGENMRVDDTPQVKVGGDSPRQAAERARMQETAKRLGFPLTQGDAKATPDLTKGGNLWQRVEAQFAQLPGTSRYYQMNREQKDQAISREVNRLIDGGFKIDKPDAKWMADPQFFDDMAGIPKKVSKHLGDRDTRRALEEVEGFGKPAKVAPAARQRAIAAVNTDTDDIVTAVRKLGGINKGSTQGDWAGLEFAGNPSYGPVFRNQGGQSHDDMASSLYEKGYLSAPDAIDEMMDKFRDANLGTGSQNSLFSSYRQFENESEAPLEYTLSRLVEKLDKPATDNVSKFRAFKPGEEIPLSGGPSDLDTYLGLRSNLGSKGHEAGPFTPSGKVYSEAAMAFDNAAQRQHPELDLPRQRENYTIQKLLEPALDPDTGNYDLVKISSIVKKNQDLLPQLGERGQALRDISQLSRYVRQPNSSGTAENALAQNLATMGLGGTAGAGITALGSNDSTTISDYIKSALIGGFAGKYVIPKAANRMMQTGVNPIMGRETLRMSPYIRDPLLGASRLYPAGLLSYQPE